LLIYEKKYSLQHLSRSISAVVYSQNLTISGTVVDDSSRSPISGVSVVVTETKQGVSTDAKENSEFLFQGQDQQFPLLSVM
jgi:hypothetical protein